MLDAKATPTHSQCLPDLIQSPAEFVSLKPHSHIYILDFIVDLQIESVVISDER